MIDASIAHECTTLHAGLRRAASHAANPATLLQIAQAMANISYGVAAYRAGAVTVTRRDERGLITVATVAHADDSATVQTGIKSLANPWSCSCLTTMHAFNGVCVHIVAVKLAIAVEAATMRHRERAQRRKLLPIMQMHRDVAKSRLQWSQEALRRAQHRYAAAESAYQTLHMQIAADDAEAHALGDDASSGDVLVQEAA